MKRERQDLYTQLNHLFDNVIPEQWEAIERGAAFSSAEDVTVTKSFRYAKIVPTAAAAVFVLVTVLLAVSGRPETPLPAAVPPADTTVQPASPTTAPPANNDDDATSSTGDHATTAPTDTPPALDPPTEPTPSAPTEPVTSTASEPSSTSPPSTTTSTSHQAGATTTTVAPPDGHPATTMPQPDEPISDRVVIHEVTSISRGYANSGDNTTVEKTLSRAQVLTYLGTDIRPTALPAGLTDVSPDAYPITYSETGSVRYDELAFCYQNADATRSLTLYCSKISAALGEVAYIFRGDTTLTNFYGTAVLLGHQAKDGNDIFVARFDYAGIQIQVVTQNLTQEEFLDAVRSMIK